MVIVIKSSAPMAERKEKRTKTLSESLENADLLEPQFTLNNSMSGFVFEPDGVDQGGALGGVGRCDAHGPLLGGLFFLPTKSVFGAHAGGRAAVTTRATSQLIS